jgi:hypothetical protein
MSNPRDQRRVEAAHLRSQRWFAPDDLRSFGHRSRIAQMGYSGEEVRDRPVIAILNTWSDLAQCHTHFRERAAEVKRGVWQAGGFPVEIPVLALSEMFVKPTAMFHRNLLALEVEEVLRSQPIDGVVLMGGCDKTVPGLLLGAISVDLPAIFLPAGPMLAGRFRSTRLGSGTDVWKYWAERQAGCLSECAWRQIEEGIARSPGTCMTMGTASTMAAIVETLGLALPGSATIPAVHSAHARHSDGGSALEPGSTPRRIDLDRDGSDGRLLGPTSIHLECAASGNGHPVVRSRRSSAPAAERVAPAPFPGRVRGPARCRQTSGKAGCGQIQTQVDGPGLLHLRGSLRDPGSDRRLRLFLL